jgi:twinkle protein
MEDSTVVSKGPCPDCGSDDNLATYSDGHQYCFSPGCGYKKGTRSDVEDQPQPSKAPKNAIPFDLSFSPEGLKKRGLKADTLKRFGYFRTKVKGKYRDVANYYNLLGEMVYQKYRTPEKEFFFQPLVEDAPSPGKCQLFGQHIWGERNDRMVVITEGELDALSVAQETNFKFPVVSIPMGVGSAVASLKTNFQWLDRFEKIVLWMDNDGPGQEVVADMAQIFEPGKVFNIKHPTAKDASELLQTGRNGEVYQSVYGATLWAPGGIVDASECIDDVLAADEEAIVDYPWALTQSATCGMRTKEVTYHIAGTGVGKTSILVELQHHLMKHSIKFGVMRFEDTRRKLQIDLMSRHVKQRLHLNPLDDEEMKALHKKLFPPGQVHLFDPEQADWKLDALLGYVRYMAQGLDCRVIFLDPLSFFVTSAAEKDDRKALDKLAYEFARLVKQANVSLHVAHHLSGDRGGSGPSFEEGRQISLNNIRGSAAIAQYSMNVLAYERDQQGPRPDLTQIRILKCRHTGTTGTADVLKWDDLQGTNTPTNEPFPVRGENEGSAFGPVEQEY